WRAPSSFWPSLPSFAFLLPCHALHGFAKKTTPRPGKRPAALFQSGVWSGPGGCRRRCIARGGRRSGRSRLCRCFLRGGPFLGLLGRLLRGLLGLFRGLFAGLLGGRLLGLLGLGRLLCLLLLLRCHVIHSMVLCLTQKTLRAFAAMRECLLQFSFARHESSF